MSNSIFNGQGHVNEKTHYKGVLRIIGRIIEKASSDKTVGYMIMVEKTNQVKMYTTEQTVWLLQKYKFVNAELDNGKIVNTECAMDRLMRFDTSGQIIDTNKIMILGKLFKDGEASGFKVLAPTGKVVNLSSDGVLKYVDKGVSIVNAKVVGTDSDKKYISAIKQEFTKIELNDYSGQDSVIKASKAANWRYQRKIKKLKSASGSIINNMIIPRGSSLSHIWYGRSDNLYCRYHKAANGKYTTDIDINKLLKILCKEVSVATDNQEFAKRVMEKLTSGELDKLISKNFKEHKYSTKNSNMNLNATDLAFWLLMQIFIDANKHSIPKVTYANTERFICNLHRVALFKDLKSNGLILPNVDKALSQTIDTFYSNNDFNYVAKYIERTKLRIARENGKLGKKELDRYRLDAVTNFDYTFTSQQAADLMSFNVLSVNDSALSSTYLSDFIEYFDTYRNMANCLGDLVIIAKVEKALKYGSYKTEHVRNKHNIDDIRKIVKEMKYNLGDSEAQRERSIKTAEMLLGILAINRPDLVITYINNTIDKVPELQHILPGLVDDTVNHELSRASEIYYKSGLCVLYSSNDDGAVYNFRRRPFRSMSKTHKEKIRNSDGYKTLNTELISILSLIVSEKCTNEFMAETMIETLPSFI